MRFLTHPMGRLALRLGPSLLVVALFFASRYAGDWLWLVLALLAAVTVNYPLDFLLKRFAVSRAEQCAMEVQLLQSQKLAEVGKLSSGIAHEINTPLAIIAQEAELLRMQEGMGELAGPGVEAFRDSVSQIVIQVERCRDITHKLLALARKREPVMQETDINALVEDMAGLVEKEARLNNVAILRRLDPNLQRMQTDPSLLRQVILNLLNNALQALGKDGTITVSTAPLPGGRLEISVADTGPGIPDEVMDSIFTPFFTTKPPGKGTGLGLSICMLIMQSLGGDIRVESRPGAGATFHVTLAPKAGNT